VRTLDDLDVDGKRALVRVDFNVPLDSEQNITDDARIRAALPTLKELREKGARLVLLSHLGRPKGRDAKLSLKPAAERLSDLLGEPVELAHDLDSVPDADIVMVENVRFFDGETKNDAELAKRYAALGDVYINDAFGSAHRAHASTEGIVSHVKASAAGLLMADEIAHLGKVLEAPDRPFVAILGGAKVSDKLEVIENLIPRVDALLIGGAMAYTFLKARGVEVGKSLVETDLLDTARDVERRAKERGLRLELPSDHVVAAKLEAGVPTEVLEATDPSIGDRMGLDIGPKTIDVYRSVIAGARTVIWNGPMGVFEIDAFAKGTIAVAKAVAAVKGTTVIGGGGSIAAVAKAGVTDKITHISTGGGASLEFLGGRTLPGVAALG